MKAARLYGERDIRIDSDLDAGTVGPGDVSIDVAVCGICGSDLHEFRNPDATPAEPHPQTGASRPVVIGHEFSGVVSDVGAEVTRLSVGDRVAVHPNIPCYECVYCEDGAYNRCENVVSIGFHTDTGGFAERAVIPEQHAHVLPEGVELWEGALVEPLAVGLHAVRRSGMRAGDTVGIFGAGPIGLTTLRAARAAGASRIFASEPNDHRRDIAADLGADVTIDPTAESAEAVIADATPGGVHAAFEFAGVEPAFDAAVRSTRRGGTITVGSLTDDEITVDVEPIVFGERTVRGTFCYGFPPRSFRTEFAAIIAAIARGEVDTDAFVTGRISLDDLVSGGYERLLDPETEHVKILVEP